MLLRFYAPRKVGFALSAEDVGLDVRVDVFGVYEDAVHVEDAAWVAGKIRVSSLGKDMGNMDF